MAILKFEIDTDEVFNDEYDNTSFENLIRHAIGETVKVEMQGKFSGAAFNTVSKNIALECIWQVEKKLRNLINEDIVMQDRWGKPEFVGTVEDYIKKQIDDRLLRPVNESGKTLTGCSLDSNKNTWIEYIVRTTVESEMKNSLIMVRREVKAYCKSTLNNELESFKKNTLNGIIMDRLEAIGIAENK